MHLILPSLLPGGRTCYQRILYQNSLGIPTSKIAANICVTEKHVLNVIATYHKNLTEQFFDWGIVGDLYFTKQCLPPEPKIHEPEVTIEQPESIGAIINP